MGPYLRPCMSRSSFETLHEWVLIWDLACVGPYFWSCLPPYVYCTSKPIDLVIECSPMTWEAGVRSQVESYQRLRKWYLIAPCLILSSIRYVSRVKWSKPGKAVAPSPTHQCSSYWKGSFQVALDYFTLLNLYTNQIVVRQLISSRHPFLSKYSILFYQYGYNHLLH